MYVYIRIYIYIYTHTHNMQAKVQHDREQIASVFIMFLLCSQRVCRPRYGTLQGADSPKPFVLSAFSVFSQRILNVFSTCFQCVQAKVQHDRERILKNRARMEEDKALLLRDSGFSFFFLFPLTFFPTKRARMEETRPSSPVTLLFFPPFPSIYFQQKIFVLLHIYSIIYDVKNKALPLRTFFPLMCI